MTKSNPGGSAVSTSLPSSDSHPHIAPARANYGGPPDRLAQTPANPGEGLAPAATPSLDQIRRDLYFEGFGLAPAKEWIPYYLKRRLIVRDRRHPWYPPPMYLITERGRRIRARLNRRHERDEEWKAIQRKYLNKEEA